MRLMRERDKAIKQGLLPPKAERRPSHHSRVIGGMVIESAEGVRFAHTATPLPRAVLPETVPVELEAATELNE